MAFAMTRSDSMDDFGDDRISRDLEAMLISGQIAMDHIAAQTPKDELAYRWIGPRAKFNQQIIEDVGMFSRGQDRGDVLQSDRGSMYSINEQDDSRSEYLSISASPQRVVNFMVGPRSVSDGEVAIISLKMLAIMQRPIKRVRDLTSDFTPRARGDEKRRTMYVADTLLLVHEFIPASCILGYINAEVFKRLWQDNINQDPGRLHPKPLTWPDLEPLIEKTSAFSVPPQLRATSEFVPDDDDQYPTTLPDSGLYRRRQDQLDTWGSTTSRGTSHIRGRSRHVPRSSSASLFQAKLDRMAPSSSSSPFQANLNRIAPSSSSSPGQANLSHAAPSTSSSPFRADLNDVAPSSSSSPFRADVKHAAPSPSISPIGSNLKPEDKSSIDRSGSDVKSVSEISSN